jgi:tellurite methyltransferase
MRVLDLACGTGRHSLAAAARGAEVTAWDRSAAKLEEGRAAAAARGVQGDWPAVPPFDAVLQFNYLDRERMARVLDALAPGGTLIMETFLTTQRDLGWGPTNEKHLLGRGELAQLITPLEVLHGREVLEPVDVERWRAVASVVARRRPDEP